MDSLCHGVRLQEAGQYRAVPLSACVSDLGGVFVTRRSGLNAAGGRRSKAWLFRADLAQPNSRGEAMRGGLPAHERQRGTPASLHREIIGFTGLSTTLRGRDPSLRPATRMK